MHVPGWWRGFSGPGEVAVLQDNTRYPVCKFSGVQGQNLKTKIMTFHLLISTSSPNWWTSSPDDECEFTDLPFPTSLVTLPARGNNGEIHLVNMHLRTHCISGIVLGVGRHSVSKTDESLWPYGIPNLPYTWHVQKGNFTFLTTGRDGHPGSSLPLFQFIVYLIIFLRRTFFPISLPG